MNKKITILTIIGIISIFLIQNVFANAGAYAVIASNQINLREYNTEK